MNKEILMISVLFLVGCLEGHWFHDLPENAYYQNQEPTEFEKALTANPARDEAIKRLLD